MATLQAPIAADTSQSTLDDLPDFELKPEAGHYKIKIKSSTARQYVLLTVYNSTPSPTTRTTPKMNRPGIGRDSTLASTETTKQTLPATRMEFTSFGEVTIMPSRPELSSGVWVRSSKRPHDLVRSLEPGIVIGVRLCLRFGGWEIYGRNGFLVFDISSETPVSSFCQLIATRRFSFKPIAIHPYLSDLSSKTYTKAVHQVNIETKAVFKPTISPEIFCGDTISKLDALIMVTHGSGVRGLLSLQLLKAMFEKGNIMKKLCEVFDMIGGTITGGFVKTQEFYNEQPLVVAIQEVAKAKPGDSKLDAKLLDNDPNTASSSPQFDRMTQTTTCRSSFAHTSAQPRIPRDPEDQPGFPDIKIWQAVRATSATPVYFKPLEIGDYKLIDGGLRANNPLVGEFLMMIECVKCLTNLTRIWTEILSFYSPAQPTVCFLSIRTDIPPNAAVPRPRDVIAWKLNKIRKRSTAAITGYSSAATSSEATHVLFDTLMNAFAPNPAVSNYWCLNIEPHLGD
ncbi:acyl transferase/acyl hydrolase/lysophospholipase [Clohesyomyces aquaticus]|uniref:Acyl transferase/acyl hydrolase/lysophospholipase n=1 Tax=Clohesyomyces aquaticus TaxID=1231657 RepID=A0A1Y1ZG28_9PLEO|nr:acyl transferase/acyl hydrolase/lysophospholipase [Clohesyomyces aquaticus]